MSIPARILVTTSCDKKEFLKLQTSNICAGGAYFITNQIIPDMAKVDLDFVLSINQLGDLTGSDGYVELSGTVLRRDPRGIAICFNRDYEIIPIKTNKPVSRGFTSLKKQVYRDNINAD